MKKLSACLLALLLAAVLAVPAQAKSYESSGWYVTFTGDNRMDSNFNSATMNELYAGMQPGDTAVVTMQINNQNAAGTDWYMTNTVLRSLEESSDAANGAYTYRLVYQGPNSSTPNVLYDNSSVGGEEKSASGASGLKEATESLDEFFYLDTLGTGQQGTVTLTVGLDGETQGNSYQDTFAQLEMNFAVEVINTTPEVITRTRRDENSGHRTAIVYTGDRDMMPYIIAAAVSGLLLLAYALYTVRARQQKKGGRAK